MQDRTPSLHRRAAAGACRQIQAVHAAAQHGPPQTVGQVLRRQVHPGAVGDGHGLGALPADRAEEGQGEPGGGGGGPDQGGVAEAAVREAAQQLHQDPRLPEQAAGA